MSIKDSLYDKIVAARREGRSLARFRLSVDRHAEFLIEMNLPDGLLIEFNGVDVVEDLSLPPGAIEPDDKP